MEWDTNDTRSELSETATFKAQENDEHSDKEICLAALKKDRADMLECILQNGADMADLRIWILEAIKLQSNSVLQCLLKYTKKKSCRKVFKQESGGLLCTAITHGAVGAVSSLIVEGAKRTDLTVDGDSDILLALQHRQIDVLKVLLQFKQNLDAKNKNGIFPLFQAVCMGDVDVVKILVNAGAKVNRRLVNVINAEGATQMFGRKCTVQQGDTLVHFVIRELPGFVKNANEYEILCRILDMLLSKNFNKSKKNSKGFTVFDELLVSTLEDEHIYDHFIKQNFPVTHPLAYHYACMKPPRIGLALLEVLKSNVNETDRSALTPLAVACGQLNAAAASWLLDHSADPNKSTNHPMSFMDYDTFLSRALLQADRHASKQSPLHIIASRIGHDNVVDVIAIIKLLMSRGAKLNARNERDATPFSCAVQTVAFSEKFSVGQSSKMATNYLPVIHLLLQSGANPDMGYKERHSHSSIHSVKMNLECCNHGLYMRPIALMILEMSVSLGQDVDTDKVREHLLHKKKSLFWWILSLLPQVSAFIPEERLERCVVQPHSLMVLSRKVILSALRGRHLSDVVNHLSMLPVKLQDYVCLKYMLDPDWYNSQ